MARLEKNSMTRWENGKLVTYSRGDDVPDLDPQNGVTGVFLTREEGAKLSGAGAAESRIGRGKAPALPAKKSGNESGGLDLDDLGTADDDLDIIQLLEGNVREVLSHIGNEKSIDVLENILVAEGEGKNRSTVTAAINDRIKVLELEETDAV